MPVSLLLASHSLLLASFSDLHTPFEFHRHQFSLPPDICTCPLSPLHEHSAPMASFSRAFLLLALPTLFLLSSGCGDSMVDPPATGFTSIEAQAHTLVNQYRQTQGLSPLTFDDRIADIARQHSVNMAAGNVGFGHDGFDDRENQIAAQMSVSADAENVAFNKGFDDAAAKAVEDWLNSTGHRTNIEGSYTLTGIGVARASDGSYYFTQIFVKP